MTEEQAKTKWCPFARIFPAGDFWQSSNGRDMTVLQASLAEGDLGNLSRCIGSACMAWRWEELGGFERLLDRNTPQVWVKSGNSTTDGHCGLAGKP